VKRYVKLPAVITTAALAWRMAEIRHENLVLWVEKDDWIAPADLRMMAVTMLHRRIVIVPGVGRSMSLDIPVLRAEYFGTWFGGG
jgi:non-heme chloroperoxidase